MLRSANKKLSAILAVVLIALVTSPSVSAGKRHKYRSNWNASQWSLGVLFDRHPDYTEYDATTLSLRRQYSQHHAWRLNLTGVSRTLESGQNRVFHGSEYAWGFAPLRRVLDLHDGAGQRGDGLSRPTMLDFAGA